MCHPRKGRFDSWTYQQTFPLNIHETDLWISLLLINSSVLLYHLNKIFVYNDNDNDDGLFDSHYRINSVMCMSTPF